MYPDYQSQATGSCWQKLQELEDTYAQALADNMDVQGLSFLWDRIKALQLRTAVLTEKKALSCMDH